MNSIRIYYECLEQACYYLDPIVKNVFGEDVDITFIEISSLKNTSVIAEKLAPALSIRNPDGVITWVKSGEEIPLVWLEFTTQVKTLDHSMQSFNSLVAAGSARIPVVKFVAERVSRSSHGGSQLFDTRVPFQILFTQFNTPGVQLNWPTTEDGRFALRNEKYMACPDRELGLVEILNTIKVGVEQNISPADSLIEFGRIKSSELALNFKENFKKPERYVGSQRSTRFYKTSGEWTIKFNRWDHSMDPERGLCEFYHYWTGEKLNGRLHDSEAKNASQALKNFARKTGIAISDQEIKSRIDITKYIKSSRVNRAGLIILWCCKEFTVANASGKDLITFTWNAEKPDGLVNNFKLGKITSISKKDTITEDDVTFVVANRFFPQNGFQIHSVSYPGAQGDFALLQGSGRTAKRKYFDVIAHKASNNEFIVAITEAKGSARVSALEPDLKKVLKWRDDEGLSQLLKSEVNAPIDSTILSSLSYVSDTPVQMTNSNKLDFVVLVNPKSWMIWAPYKKDIPGVELSNGSTDLPTRYKY